jgi:uncharacterized membrane protein YfbV (UPF0208 family)
MNNLAPRAAGKLACHGGPISRGKCSARTLRAPQRAAAAAALQVMPVLAVAQSSPFMTGASALQTNILAWLTPIAVILVMVLGAMAMANRLRSEFAAQLRAAYRERVAQRLARTASATAEVPTTPPARDLAEVRRQAREQWLQLRSQAPPGVSRAPARAAEPPARQAEDDLAL